MKPGVFTQIYIHFVFSPKHRDRLLETKIRADVFRYISGIISNRKHKSIIINGMSDHIHILVGFNPDDRISDLVGSIKSSSSIYINSKDWLRGKFHWQNGYGAFSHSKSQLKNVYKYIKNQEKHHEKKSFRDEYNQLLKRNGIKYDKKFLFEFFD